MLLSISSAVFLLGLFIGLYTDMPIGVGLSLLLLFLLYLLLSLMPSFGRTKAGRLTVGLCSILVVAVLWQQVHQSQLRSNPLLGYGSGATINVKGYIDEEPLERKSYSRWRFRVEEISKEEGWSEHSSFLLVYSPRFPSRQYGERLILKGTLEEPSNTSGMDYKGYLSRSGIHYIMGFPSTKEDGSVITPYSPVSFLRNTLAESLQSSLPEPQASLSQGMLLGLRGRMPKDLLDTFANTGTTHILAISGQNFSMVISLLVLGITKLVGRRHPIGFSLLLLAVWCYAALTGMPPSVLRAVLMASLVLLALFVGRQPHILSAMLFSAAIMTAYEPSLLLDIGFQLSFLATAGVLFITPPLLSLSSRLLDRMSKVNDLGKYLLWLLSASILAGFGAWITTAPIILANFGTLSLVGIPATISVLPSFAPLIGLSAATSLLGIFAPWLAQPFAWLTWMIGSYMILVVRFWEGLSSGTQSANWSLHWGYLAAYYVVLCSIVWRVNSAYRARIVPVNMPANSLWPMNRGMALRLLTAILITANVLVIWLHLNFEKRPLEVTFIDVGQGDSTLIRTPEGKTILIDGGPDPDLLVNRLGGMLPFWQRKIDLVVLTHPQRDHLAGLLGAVKRYDVGHVIEGIAETQIKEYSEWRRIMADRGVPATRVNAGAVMLLDSDLKIDVMYPKASSYQGYQGDINNLSLVLRLVAPDASFLLTGDIEALAENELVHGSETLTSSVLKVAHHGSGTSSTKEFLDEVSPQAAVISVGANNSFGHPHPEVLERLGKIRTFRLDKDGSVRFVVEGPKLKVQRLR